MLQTFALESYYNYVAITLSMIFSLQIWDTTECGPGWDSNSQPSDLWATTEQSCLGEQQEDSCQLKFLI